jgi:SAM-dependent methyltransferase
MLERMYPELGFSNISRFDQRLLFFSLIRSLINKDSRVLDFGAGRDKWSEIEKGYKRSVTQLKGDCAELVACDADPVVLENPSADRKLVIEPGEPLPFEDAYFDLVYSWAVVEHLENPAPLFEDLYRVIKPGGWLCAWTPNRFGYFAIGAQLIPDVLHGWLLKRLTNVGRENERKEKDVFPTFYRANTYGQVRKVAKRRFHNHSFYTFGPPAYHANSFILAKIIDCYNKTVPGFLKPYMMIFLQKPLESNPGQ